MIPKRWVEAYLRFLLRNRVAVSLVIALVTLGFVSSLGRMRLHTDFFDFYPPDHPYIKMYQEFRRMFGSANVLTMILEVDEGDIYNPETLQKLDRMTKYIVETKGVIPYQILSIAHPKAKSINTYAGAIQIREVFYPGVPKTQEDADRVKFAVYSTRGIRGLLVSQDDRAAAINAGFWEEALDFNYLHDRLMVLKAQEEDAKHKIHITGFPWLFTSIMRYVPEVGRVFVATAAALCFLLWNYFRTWTGIWVPMFSGILSSVWGLAFGAILGFNLDPLVLVIPIFLTARALSHSVQSMDRYHEEYHRLKDKNAAIVESYSHLFAPAIASIVTDGMGLLIIAGGLCTSLSLNLTLFIAVAGWIATRVAAGPRRWTLLAVAAATFATATILTPLFFPVALIPLIRKVAIFASFWIISIFISVVTLHPIILSVINPPGVTTESAITLPPWLRRALRGLGIGVAIAVGLWVLMDVRRLMGTTGAVALLAGGLALGRWSEQIYRGITDAVIAMSAGWRRWAMIALTAVMLVVGWSYGRTLKVGDMTPGAALLFPDHPYNVAYHKLNEQFLGASQLIVIADTHREDGMKDVEPLTIMEEFADHMETAPGAGASITVIDIVKQLARLYHEGEPKWGFVPDRTKHIAELFYTFTQTGQAGDLDRFMDPTARYGSIITLFHSYSHDIIMNSIDWAKQFAAQYGGPQVSFLFAGGLFGVLAAVNQAVDSSYWINLGVIFAVVALCLYLTYRSWTASLILMVPVVLSQVVCEAIMVIYRIDLNVNSLPIAAAGAGVGVDYGIYHFSRMIDAFDEGRDVDDAVDYATATTGKAIIFTATTMLAATIFWWFADLKFQAEMGLLLALLMGFNTFGGLVVVPALVKVLQPTFLVQRRDQALERERRAAAVG
jgi:predicted RND superfamily exporter protein